MNKLNYSTVEMRAMYTRDQNRCIVKSEGRSQSRPSTNPGYSVGACGWESIARRGLMIARIRSPRQIGCDLPRPLRVTAFHTTFVHSPVQVRFIFDWS